MRIDHETRRKFKEKSRARARAAFIQKFAGARSHAFYLYKFTLIYILITTAQLLFHSKLRIDNIFFSKKKNQAKINKDAIDRLRI